MVTPTGLISAAQSTGSALLELAGNTVKAVMIGIVGTAAAQALVALAGFLVAGVPGALLLAAGIFFLSMVPVGPPLIWGGAAFWLYQQDQSGWAVFMVLWGTLAVSSVDNFLKPMLISRTASLPILLIALGAFGGVLAFGFIGLFLGPTFLALGQALVREWTAIEPQIAAPGLTYENIFRVIVMQFIDAYNFDVRAIKRSCVHIVSKDLKIIPFETMNMFYRDEKADALVQLRRPG